MSQRKLIEKAHAEYLDHLTNAWKVTDRRMVVAAARLLEKLRAGPWQPRWDIAPELSAVTRAATRFQEVAASLLPASG